MFAIIRSVRESAYSWPRFHAVCQIAVDTPHACHDPQLIEPHALLHTVTHKVHTLFLGLAQQISHFLPLLLGTKMCTQLQQQTLHVSMKLPEHTRLLQLAMHILTFFLHSLRARLSLPTFNSSDTRLS